MSKIDTQLAPAKPSDDDPQSVIHAPSSFKNFEETKESQQSPTQGSENTVVSPSTPEAITSPIEKVKLQRSNIHEPSLIVVQ